MDEQGRPELDESLRAVQAGSDPRRYHVVIGVLVSDLMLAWLDPRIRFGGGQAR